MIDLEKLRIFYAVAKHGSVTAAASQLGLSQPAISRQISTLEDQLKIALFHRHTRGLILTEQGEQLLETVKKVFSTLIMTEAILTEELKPRGALRIACPDGFGALWLAPRMDDFMREYPEIQLSIILVGDDEEVDLTVREADVAIRTTQPENPGLIAVPFMTSSAKVYASQEYLQKFGHPQTFESLNEHRLITFDRDHRKKANWLLTAGCEEGESREPYMAFNSVYGVREVIRQGIGIGALHPYAALMAPELIEILPDGRKYSPHIQRLITYPEPLRHSMRIAAFRSFLLRKVLTD